MRCDEALYIVGKWIARMAADHAWRTITGVYDIKWNEMNEMSVEKWHEICGKGKQEKPREKPIQPPFRQSRNYIKVN